MLSMPATPLLALTSRFPRHPSASGQRPLLLCLLSRRLAPPARFEPIRTSLVIATGLVAPATPQGARTFDVAATRTTQCRNADDPLAFAAIGGAGVVGLRAIGPLPVGRRNVFTTAQRLLEISDELMPEDVGRQHDVAELRQGL